MMNKKFTIYLMHFNLLNEETVIYLVTLMSDNCVP